MHLESSASQPARVVISWRSGPSYASYELDTTRDHQTLYSGMVGADGAFAGTYDWRPRHGGGTDTRPGTWAGAASAARSIDASELPHVADAMPDPSKPLRTPDELSVVVQTTDGSIRRHDGTIRELPNGVRDAVIATRKLHNERYGMALAVPVGRMTRSDGETVELVMRPSPYEPYIFPNMERLREQVAAGAYPHAAAIVTARDGYRLLSLGAVTGPEDPLDPGAHMRATALPAGSERERFVRASAEVAGLIDPRSGVFVDLRDAPVSPVA